VKGDGLLKGKHSKVKIGERVRVIWLVLDIDDLEIELGQDVLGSSR